VRVWRVVVAIGLVTSALAGCGHSPRRGLHAPAPRLTFSYNTSQPLGYVDRGVVAHRGSIAVHDIAYVSGGERVDGYLVERPGLPRRPGIVLVHGSGGDRSELLGGAGPLAERGTVAMALTGPSAGERRRARAGAGAFLAQSRAVTARDVIAVRRAADLRAWQPLAGAG